MHVLVSRLWALASYPPFLQCWISGFRSLLDQYGNINGHSSKPQWQSILVPTYQAVEPVLQPGATTRVLQCPINTKPFIRLGELGKGTVSAAVTEQLIKQCISGSSCTLDMAALDMEYEGKTLRVEWFCSCGEGFYDLPPGEGVVGTCEPCPVGMYKAYGMTDCKASDGHGEWWGLASPVKGPVADMHTDTDDKPCGPPCTPSAVFTWQIHPSLGQ
jgi:hypothetical protein